MGRLLGQREERQWTPEPVIPPIPGVDVAGRPRLAAAPEQALFLSTVWACVTLIADTISTMPLETYRRTGTVPSRITDPQLVLTPEPDLTQSEWLHRLIVSLLIYGNAYALKLGVSASGVPGQLMLLDPKTVNLQINNMTGDVKYLVGPDRQDRTAVMWHVRGLTLPGSKVGLSPIAFAADDIGLDRAARKFAIDFFNAGGLPVSVLESDQVINQEQATTLKERLKAATANREPAVLGLGAKLSANGVKPDESQFLETQQTNIARIAQRFGVPAERVGGKTGSSLTYSTVEGNNQLLLDAGVRPWLKRIEDAFFALLPQPQFVRFDFSALLRTDAESQAKIEAIRTAAKNLAPSEVRTKRGEPPFTDEQKQEVELVPAAINIATGLPKSLPNPPTPATADDVPDVQVKPKLEAV